jgi:hypothetical protein
MLVTTMPSHASNGTAELVLDVAHQDAATGRQSAAIDYPGTVVDHMGAASVRQGHVADHLGATADHKCVVVGR